LFAFQLPVIVFFFSHRTSASILPVRLELHDLGLLQTPWREKNLAAAKYLKSGHVL